MIEQVPYDHPSMVEILARARFDLMIHEDKTDSEVYDIMIAELKLVITCPTQVPYLGFANHASSYL